MRRLATLADVEAAISEAFNSGSFFFADLERNQIDKYPGNEGEESRCSTSIGNWYK